MKAYIISNHCISSKEGAADALEFARKYSNYIGGKTKLSPYNNKQKVDIDFEKYKEPIVCFSLACGLLGKLRIFFGTTHGDRIYSPVVNTDMAHLIDAHKLKKECPTWIKNLTSS